MLKQRANSGGRTSLNTNWVDNTFKPYSHTTILFKYYYISDKVSISN